GLIEKVSFKEGMQIKKGDILVRLNSEFIQQSIDIRSKEKEGVSIKIQNAEKNLNRFEMLYKEEAATEKAYDDLADRLRELQTHHEMIQLQIDKFQLEMKKSSIRAPFDGIILQKFKNEGEWVSPGTPVCSLGSTADMVVNVAVSEDLIRFIHPGSNIFLSINAVSKEFKGTVQQITPVADIATKTFQIKISVPYFQSAIQNMSASVHVPVSDQMKLRMIKRDALIRYQGKDLVYTIKEGKATVLPINIVVYDGEYLGVDNPYIVPGMPLVVDGNDRLKPDQEVEIIDKNSKD
ncbi:MAG: efflux RND transporter periplasmic adaptor subunit, partial [Deltaproteobacteria bacterium]|nr:efflux RND transporter periplasmic adaptor subunit [Deltaproteobacteria bacterium]